MSTKITEGAQSTVVPIAAKKKAKSLPTLAAITKPEIESGLGRIADEKIRQVEALKVCTAELASLEKSKAEAEKMQDRKVEELLSKHFGSSSGKGLIDRVLKSEFTEPRLLQLQGNIKKLTAQEIWHGEKIALLDTEQRLLIARQKDLDADTAAGKAYDAYKAWCDIFFESEKVFDVFKEALHRARSYDAEFHGRRLSAQGVSDEAFTLLCGSHMNEAVFHRQNQAGAASALSKASMLGEENPFYEDETNRKRRQGALLQGWSNRADSWQNTPDIQLNK